MGKFIAVSVVVGGALILVFGGVWFTLFSGPNEAANTQTAAGSAYEIVSLLPPDAIPAIYNPEFVTGAEADEQYAADERVLGVEINGDARAYSIPYLNGHEIVNDVVGGEAIAVTW